MSEHWCHRSGFAGGGYAYWIAGTWGKIPAGIAYRNDNDARPKIYSSWFKIHMYIVRCWLAVSVFKFSSRACVHSSISAADTTIGITTQFIV